MNIADNYDAFVRLLRSRLPEQDDSGYACMIGVDCPDLTTLDDFVRGVCLRYLEAPDAERQEIRSTFRDPDARSFLPWFAARLSERFKDSGSVDLLLVGLAALSIHDERDVEDYRDAGATLRMLYRRAENAGIDAKPFLRRVAALSSDCPSHPRVASVAAQMRFPFPDLRKPPINIRDEIDKSRQEHAEGVPVFFYQCADGTPIGPLTARALREFRYRGIINAQTMLREGCAQTGEWRPADEFADVVPRARK
jgi:hypothetical protein